MQKSNLNQQLGPHQRRKCIAYKPNDFFQSFDKSQQTALANYEQAAESLMVKSLAILIDSIRNPTKLHKIAPSSPKSIKKMSEETLMSYKKNPPTFKKQVPESIGEQDQSTNPQKQIMEMIHFEKTGKKIDKSIKKMEQCREQKQSNINPIQNKKHQKLMDSLKKLSIQEELDAEMVQNIPQKNNRNLTEDTNLLEFDEEAIKKKNFNDILLCNSKSKPSIPLKKQQIEFDPIDSQDSEYQITDYSSNQSSNDDGDYSEKYVVDFDEPMFGTIFAQGGKNYNNLANKLGATPNFKNGSDHLIAHQPLKLNFKPLLDSPKKSKSKKKRLYINKKKVPRWAEDLNQVARVYASKEQRKLQTEFKNILGVCIVENLQTNSIFKRNDVYTRSSTVKWDKDKYVI